MFKNNTHRNGFPGGNLGEPLDTDKIYELARQGLSKKEIAQELGYKPARFSQKFNNSQTAQQSFVKGKEEREKWKVEILSIQKK